MQECAQTLMLQRRAELVQGTTVIGPETQTPARVSKGLHVIDRRHQLGGMTRRHRLGCTWPPRRTGNLGLAQKHGAFRLRTARGRSGAPAGQADTTRARDWWLWASRTALLPLDSQRRGHPSACDRAKKTAQRVRIVYAPGLALRIASVYSVLCSSNR